MSRIESNKKKKKKPVGFISADVCVVIKFNYVKAIIKMFCIKKNYSFGVDKAVTGLENFAVS
jgi:hypothetical protein